MPLVEERALIDDGLVLGKNRINLLQIRDVLVTETRLLGRQVGRHHDTLGVFVLARRLMDRKNVVLGEERRLATKSFGTVAWEVHVVVVRVDVRMRRREARTVSYGEQLSLVFRVIASPI